MGITNGGMRVGDLASVLFLSPRGRTLREVKVEDLVFYCYPLWLEDEGAFPAYTQTPLEMKDGTASKLLTNYIDALNE